jgi:hypothetical protein
MKTQFLATAALIAVLALPATSLADHSWGSYHWARRSNPFTLKVVDSNTDNWDDNLAAALEAWSNPTGTYTDYLDFVVEAGDDSARGRKRCSMISGKIRSCNAEYGTNGWLGLASINVSGGHITQATSKMNDSYLNSTRYNYNETNRQHVMCQEIGHDFGLSHQDESGADLGTCMDYANRLDNPKPNAHDFLQLGTIYSHLDSSTTIAAAATLASQIGDDPDGPENWGQLVRQSANGRSSTYVKVYWNGMKRITHVLWVQEVAEVCPSCDHRDGQH